MDERLLVVGRDDGRVTSRKQARPSAKPDPGADGSRVRDRDARERQMIEAALGLFSEHGYAPVSTRQIADAAGCSETLLFRYFGGKHGLLKAISNGVFEQAGERPDDLDQYDDVEELVERYLLRVFDGVRRRAPALKVVVAALVNEPDMATEFKRLHDAEVDVVAKQLRRLQGAGVVNQDFDVRAVATAIEEVGFALGFLMQVIYRVSRAELAGVARQFARALSHGLTGPAPVSPVPESLRRETLRAARQAHDALGRVIGSMEDPTR